MAEPSGENMSTTSLFIELLVVGIQATVWCALLVCTLSGYEWVKALPGSLNNWAAPASVLYLAFAYTLGIIVDRLADLLLMESSPISPYRWLKDRPWAKESMESDPGPRMVVLHYHGKVADLLEFIRSRMRVVRPTTLNCLLITVTSILFLISNGFLLRWVSCVAVIGVVATAASWYIHGILDITYRTRVNHAKKLIESATGCVSKKDQPEDAPVEGTVPVQTAV